MPQTQQDSNHHWKPTSVLSPSLLRLQIPYNAKSQSTMRSKRTLNIPDLEKLTLILTAGSACSLLDWKASTRRHKGGVQRKTGRTSQNILARSWFISLKNTHSNIHNTKICRRLHKVLVDRTSKNLSNCDTHQHKCTKDKFGYVVFHRNFTWRQRNGCIQ